MAPFAPMDHSPDFLPSAWAFCLHSVNAGIFRLPFLSFRLVIQKLAKVVCFDTRMLGWIRRGRWAARWLQDGKFCVRDGSCLVLHARRLGDRRNMHSGTNFVYEPPWLAHFHNSWVHTLLGEGTCNHAVSKAVNLRAALFPALPSLEGFNFFWCSDFQISVLVWFFFSGELIVSVPTHTSTRLSNYMLTGHKQGTALSVFT